MEAREARTRRSGLEILEIGDPEAGIVGYCVDGKVTAAQARPIFERFEQALAAGRKVRILAEMRHCGGFELAVVAEKAKHLPAIFKTVERVAIVGDTRWLEFYTKLFDPITKMEIKHFTTHERNAALEWLKR